MTLRQKTLLVTAVIMLVAIAAFFMVSKFILMQSYNELERTFVIKNLQRVLNAIENDLDVLSAIAGDWAFWDDSYVFVQDRNADFIEKNLMNSTFVVLRLNTMVFLDRQGRIVYGKGFNLKNGTAAPVPQELSTALRRNSKLRPLKDKRGVKGILNLPEGPMLFAARPILDTNQTGPVRGTLFLGRYLNDYEVDRLAAITSLSVSVAKVNDTGRGLNAHIDRPAPRKEDYFGVRTISSKNIEGYTTMRDVNGVPALTVRIIMPREIYRQGQKTHNLFFFSLLVFGVVLVSVALILLDKSILSRLFLLIHDVQRIGGSGDLSGRVRLTGKDELTSLADTINNMLMALEKTQNELRHIYLHDALTGLFNRTQFEQELRRLDDSHDPVGLILCDIDGLKLVNDGLGTEKGDALLIKTAEILKEITQPDAVVARVGGDEFGVLIPRCSPETVELVGQEIRRAVDRYNSNNAEAPLSLSMGYAVGPTEHGVLFKEASENMNREKLYRTQSARSAIVETLMAALKERDFITEGHVERLQRLLVTVAVAIGIPQHNITKLRLLAQFHDIGKVGIPDHILFKPGPLDPDEIKQMRRHCDIGYRIAQSAPDLAPIADWILKHHEWWNGEGYPAGLRGEEIPLECRLLAIVDAYDAMTSDRPYRKALSHGEAVAELQRCAGIQFDPELVQAFIRVVEGQNSD